ncbi:MAG: hypothetical protein KDA65_03635 [Planctomycetaceae bacterium]|nr:hypothetical protein [Planctomycetaceae bacterium]
MYSPSLSALRAESRLSWKKTVQEAISVVLLIGLVPLVLDAKEPDSRGSLPGQIIRDPEHSQWLMRKDGKHLFICGPGDPENFLYLGNRRPDGTRDGNQHELIQKLVQYGGNCIYLQTIRGYDKNGDGRKDGGGDGAANENPFIDGDFRKGANPVVLDQWEDWFTEMDEAGILIYLFIYDDGDAPWPYRPGQVDPGERKYVETIVNRFKHHRNLIWIVGEEHDDIDYVNDIARIISEADEYDHLLGNHHNSSEEFKTWRDDSVMNHHALQCARKTNEVHATALYARSAGEAASKSGHGFMTIYSETTDSEGNDLDDVRRYNWNIAMAGVMPMRLGMKIFDTPEEVLQSCRILQEFFESTDFYTMANHDELAFEDTKYVLADPGRSYIAYAENSSNKIGLQELSAGEYELTWLDCVTGQTVTQKNVKVSSGNNSWKVPKNIGSQVALWIRKAR